MQIYVNYIKVCFHVRKFILGPLLGLIMPTSLVWAQYVHPLDYPKVPQVDKIPSEYFLNLQLESLFQLLEQDADWIELKKEAFISKQDMKKIKLNDLNSHEDDFGIPEGFKTSKTSSVLHPNLVLNPSDKSSDPELDHNFALTNLIENSLKHIPTTQINNPIDPNLIDSSHQDELLEGIQTYPAHPKAFFHDSSVNQTENSRTTAGKPKDKHPTKTLSYSEVLTSYPVYSGITSKKPLLYYNIFEPDALEIFTAFESTFKIDTDLSGSESIQTPSLRQRRAVYNSANAYNWEIDDFDGSSISNSTLLSFDNSLNAGNSDPKFKLNVIANDGIDSLEVLAWGHIGGNALSDFSATNGFKFLTHDKNNTSISTGDVSGSFDLRVTDPTTGQTGIDSWLNDPSWHNWGVWAADNGDTREFFLTYDYNPLGYSAVPEPSTYFMTGALFCFIGFNRTSRDTFKSMLSKAFEHLKTKGNLQSIQDRIS